VAPAKEQPSGIPVGPPPEGFVVFGQISEFVLPMALAEAVSGFQPNDSLLTPFLFGNPSSGAGAAVRQSRRCFLGYRISRACPPAIPENRQGEFEPSLPPRRFVEHG